MGHRRITLHLDTIDGDAGLEGERRGGAAGQQPAATDWNCHRRYCRRVLQHLERERALAGDDRGIIVGVNENEPFGRGEMMGMGSGLGQ